MALGEEGKAVAVTLPDAVGMALARQARKDPPAAPAALLALLLTDGGVIVAGMPAPADAVPPGPPGEALAALAALAAGCPAAVMPRRLAGVAFFCHAWRGSGAVRAAWPGEVAPPGMTAARHAWAVTTDGTCVEAWHEPGTGAADWAADGAGDSHGDCPLILPALRRILAALVPDGLGRPRP